MSETIQITIITENETQDGAQERRIHVTHDPVMTLMTTLLQKELISGNFCGNRGICQRCRVRFLQAAPLPTGPERQAFTPDELRRGYRLACMARPRNDCVVRLELLEAETMEIVTNTSDLIDVSEKNDQMSQAECLIAVDLGTTTIAMQLMEIRSGRVIDTYCVMNPQRSYGADVLSRIQAAEAGAADSLREGVWNVLREGIEKFGKTHWVKGRKEDGVKERENTAPYCMCIAGNTTMEHLLMGLSAAGLGKSPFTPVELGLQKCFLTLSNEAASSKWVVSSNEAAPSNGTGALIPVCLTPGISAFVGGDITAGLYALKMLPFISTVKREKASEREAVLLIDLGTNGEMAMTDGTRMIVTAAAAGPAFEGGPGKAAAGSDMVALTAHLLKEGIIDRTGLMADPYFEEGVSLPLADGRKDSCGEASLYLTQKDIRNLQMAKAAVRAGVEILHRKLGEPFVTQVYLAGGFGYYLDVDAAVAIGLLPEQLRTCTKAVGNASLAGAFQMGKDLWTGKLTEEALAEMMRGIESINLAEQEAFEALYIRYMNLESS